MQENFLNFDIDFSNQKVSCPLSGGINSMAVLIWLASLPVEFHPSEIHIFYAHFTEHSKDTFQFVADGIRYAYNKFGKDKVKVKITRNSVNKYFIKAGWIPHPTKSPCSTKLKFEPMEAYNLKNNIDFDLIGYVREEKQRMKRQQKRNVNGKLDTICHLTDAECFELVDQEIGWHPAIYDIRINNTRVFLHNNCLPCKNMSTNQLKAVEIHFPEYWAKAKEVEEKTGSYWGRLPVVNKCDYCLFD